MNADSPIWTAPRSARSETLRRLASAGALAFLTNPPRALRMALRAVRVTLRGGPGALARTIRDEVRGGRSGYMLWIHRYDELSRADIAAIRRRIDELETRPTFAVALRPPAADLHLEASLASITAQLYPDVRIVVVVPAGASAPLRHALERRASEDRRIQVVDDDGSATLDRLLDATDATYLMTLPHGSRLAPHALFMLAERHDRVGECDAIDFDDDLLDEGLPRRSPSFRPQWSRDLFYSTDYPSRAIALNRAGVLAAASGRSLGSTREAIFALIERDGAPLIEHIPHVLAHHLHAANRSGGDAGALAAHLERRGIDARVERTSTGILRVRYVLAPPLPLVTVIIATRDALELLRGTVDSVLERTDYVPLEIVIIDNQSRDPETLAYFAQIVADPRVRVIPYDHPFNYAAMNNLGAQTARGEVLLLLNNDILATDPDWLREMVALAMRPEIGAVGAKLHYKDGRIQHAGIVLGIRRSAGHAFRRFAGNARGAMDRAVATGEFSAVTAACLAVRRAVYDEVGGLDETNLAVAFNDVDFCLRLRERGYSVILTPHAELIHLESATRGSDMSPDRRARFERELAYLQSRWNDVMRDDPFYSPNLTDEAEDFTLAFPPRRVLPWLAERAQIDRGVRS